LASQGDEDGIVAAIHLKIDFDSMFVCRDAFDEGLVFCKPDSVGVDHHVVDGLREGVLKNSLEVWV
jgi:hypothetical protein